MHLVRRFWSGSIDSVRCFAFLSPSRARQGKRLRSFISGEELVQAAYIVLSHLFSIDISFPNKETSAYWSMQLTLTCPFTSLGVHLGSNKRDTLMFF